MIQGLGGGLTDIMQSRDYNVIGITFNSEAKEKDKYPNVISEIWFDVGKRIQELSCTRDKRLEAELANRKAKLDKKDRRAIESKDDYKKRGFRSPDIADAFLLAFYQAKISAAFSIVDSPWNN